MNSETTRERKQLLWRIDNLFEVPLIILGFIWLILLVIELVYESNRIVVLTGIVIWIIFILDFLLKLLLAPA